MKEVGFTTINNAKQNGNWDAAYSSNMIMEIPKDLQKALVENKIAWKNFINFSNSTRIQYIYWINSAKKVETRQKRINEVVKKASQNIKPS
ncbi:YdeI family protein [Thermoproteota archaeon]